MENNQFKAIMTAIQGVNENVQELKDRVQNIEVEVLEIKGKVQNLEVGILELKGRVQNLEEGQLELKEKVQNLEVGHINLKEKVQRIDETVMKIEVEHGEKLQALLDAFKVNSEKIYKNEKNLESCEIHLEKHDDEIYYLNSKVQGL